MGAEHHVVAVLEVIGVVLHKGGAAFKASRHHFHDAQQRGGFPVAFARKAVALLHQTLYRKARQLFKPVQVFKRGGEGVETAIFQETLHAKFDTCGIKNVLALVAVNLRGRGQAVAAFIFIHQRVDIAFADVVNYGHQIAHAPGVHREAELDLRGDFIPFGDGDFTHVVAKARHFQVTGILFRYRLTHPRAKTPLRLFVLPVARHHAMLQTHTRADEAELAAAVRGLVQVHKVHIDAAPRDLRVELGMELQQRFIKDGKTVDPHLRRREGMQPDHQTRAFVVIVGVAANGGDLVRCGAERLQHQFARQLRFSVQRVHHLFGVLVDLTQRFRAVKVLAANHKPHFILIENCHHRVLNVSGPPGLRARQTAG
ncbi:hypothetical protein BN131_4047 [Cronobacter malonaticus 681]|nr:hypothetical protein BN131_4047 [Cronobacter malonaticus 681]